MTKQIDKKLLFIILTFSSLVLTSAFVIEYKFGHTACKLCLYERIPYFLSILLISKFFFIRDYEKITLLILSLVFICSTSLAFYHLGIEQGFFEESSVCAVKDLSKTLSKEEIVEQLKQSSVSCKDVSFRLLGLSIAAINTIFSFILSAIFIRLFINYEKN